jgi:hypothetical protein
LGIIIIIIITIIIITTPLSNLSMLQGQWTRETRE